MKQSVKYLSFFLILSIQVQVLYCNSNKFQSKSKFTVKAKASGKFTFKAKPEEPKEPQLPQDNYVGYTPLWKGWVKYFHVESSTKIISPSEFFINNGFFTQKVLKQDLLTKVNLPEEENSPDNQMYLNVPSKFQFFATIDNHFVNISSDRKNPLVNKVESLNLDMVDPIQDSEVNLTGLREMGKFREGFCYDVSSHLLPTYKKEFMPTFGDYKTSRPEHWVFCFETQNEMKKFGSIITAVLKAKESLRERPINSQEKKKKEENSSIEKYTGLDANPKLDGYLVKINDWTKCTLKCGGGFSFQQWKCVPPKEGGKACIGDLIRKKPCNEQPCPSISTGGGNNEDANVKREEVIEDPIIKSQPITNRLQQNVDCYIRDEDVMHVFIDPEQGRVSIPSRLILNNKSLSLFSDIEENKIVFSFDIKKSTISLVAKENCCFKAKSQNKEFKMCGMSNCSTFAKSWTRSFDLFKSKCYTANLTEPEFNDKAPEIPPKDTNNLGAEMEVDEDTADAKSEIIKKKLEEKSKRKAENTVNEVQKQALKAIVRDIDIEEMIRKEEMIKAQEKVKEKLNELKNEEKKKEKLDAVFDKQEEKKNEVVAEIKQTTQINTIVTEAENQIKEKRDELKKKIEKIRKQAERRSKQIQTKINLIRNKMAKSLVDGTKAGNALICKESWGVEEKMSKYCNDNIVDDYGANEQCKIEDNFCYACCDNEFGKINVTGKDGCYSTCLGKESLRGDWLKIES